MNTVGIFLQEQISYMIPAEKNVGYLWLYEI